MITMITIKTVIWILSLVGLGSLEELNPAVSAWPVNSNLNFLGKEPSETEPIQNDYFKPPGFYHPGTHAFYIGCEGSTDLKKPAEAFKNLQGNDGGCYVMVNNPVQAIVVNYHNASDAEKNSHAVANSDQIFDICQVPLPPWHDVKLINSMPGLSDVDILIPTVKETKEFDICGVPFKLSGVKLDGNCSIAFDTPNQVKICSYEKQMAIGVYIKDLSHHTAKSVSSLQVNNYINKGMIALHSALKNTRWSMDQNKSVLSQLTTVTHRFQLVPNECRDIDLTHGMLSVDKKFVNVLIKCGSKVIEHKFKHSQLSMCDATYTLSLFHWLCLNFEWLKYTLCVLLTFIILKSNLFNKLQNNVIFTPLYVLTKPLDILLSKFPLKCKYCKMPKVNPLHSCEHLCTCGFEAATDGSVPDHNCPLSLDVKPSISANQAEKGVTSKLLTLNLNVDETDSVTSSAYSETTEAKTNYNPNELKAVKDVLGNLKTPMNRHLVRFLLSSFLFSLLMSLIPESMATDEISRCTSAGINIKIREGIVYNLRPRAPVYDPSTCKTREDVNRFLIGPCVLRQKSLCDLFKLENNDCYKLTLQKQMQITDNLLSLSTDEVWVQLEQVYGSNINELEDNEFCNLWFSTLMTIQKSMNKDFRIKDLIDKNLPQLNYHLNNNSKIETDIEPSYSGHNPVNTVMLEYLYFSERVGTQFGKSSSVVKRNLLTELLTKQTFDEHNPSIYHPSPLSFTDMNAFELDLFKTFDETASHSELMPSKPFYLEAKQEKFYIMQQTINLIPGTSTSIKLSIAEKPLPVTFKIDVITTSYLYPYTHLYVTNPIHNDKVYSTYKCVETCSSCFSALNSLVDNVTYSHSKCWSDINNWGCEGKGCWTINTGSLCAYCHTTQGAQKVDVIKLMRPNAKAKVCITLNNHTGCKTFDKKQVLTSTWGQVKVELSTPDDYLTNQIVVIDRMSGDVKTGEILSLGVSGDSFGTPQYTQNGDLIHEDPEVDFSWHCYNQDRFDVQVHSCVKSTFNHLKDLANTKLVSKVNLMELKNHDSGEIIFNLRLPSSIYTWADPPTKAKILLTFLNITGCMNCDKLSVLSFQVKSPISGSVYFTSDCFLPKSNIVMLQANKVKTYTLNGFALKNNSNCFIHLETIDNIMLSNSSFKVSPKIIKYGSEKHVYEHSIDNTKQVHVEKPWFPNLNLKLPNIGLGFGYDIIKLVVGILLVYVLFMIFKLLSPVFWILTGMTFTKKVKNI